jgi:CheY-like chemotaxis protein
MTKIMLVEDDKSLREIYGVRLLAEGYDIVSAADGEEALAMAIKERPQLIVSDVMMPKISGFDMLDILRSTTETKNIKVIMMTALSSEDQRERGESLGADRYLVKSQVGIEDVVRTVHEVLGDNPATAPAAPAPAPAPSPMPAPAPAPAPTTPMPTPTPPQQTAPAAPAVPQRPQQPPVAGPPVAPPPAPTIPSYHMSSSTTPKPPSTRNKVIQPLNNDPGNSSVNLNDLLDKELAKEAGVDQANAPQVPSAAAEKADVAEQLGQFQNQPPVPHVNIKEDGSVENEDTQPPASPDQTAQPEQAPPAVPQDNPGSEPAPPVPEQSRTPESPQK